MALLENGTESIAIRRAVVRVAVVVGAMTHPISMSHGVVALVVAVVVYHQRELGKLKLTVHVKLTRYPVHRLESINPI